MFAAVASFLPLLIAMVLGSQLLWACAYPQRWEAAQREVFEQLESLSEILRIEGASEILRRRIQDQAEADTRLLGEILRSLFSASTSLVCVSCPDPEVSLDRLVRLSGRDQVVAGSEAPTPATVTPANSPDASHGKGVDADDELHFSV